MEFKPEQLVATRQAEDVTVNIYDMPPLQVYEIVEQYGATQFTCVNGIIQDQGKFELDPYYIPYLWGTARDFSDDEYVTESGANVMVLELRNLQSELDSGWEYLIKLFPELAKIYVVELWETDDGFVHYCNYFDYQTYKESREDQEAKDEELSEEEVEESLDEAETQPPYVKPLTATFGQDTCVYDVGAEQSSGPCFLFLDDRRHDYSQYGAPFKCACCGDVCSAAFRGESGDICEQCAQEMVWDYLSTVPNDYDVDTDNAEFTLDWRTISTDKLKAIYFESHEVSPEEAVGNKLLFTWTSNDVGGEFLQRGYHVVNRLGYVIFDDDAADLPDMVLLKADDEKCEIGLKPICDDCGKCD